MTQTTADTRRKSRQQTSRNNPFSRIENSIGILQGLDNKLVIGGKMITVVRERVPAKIPWKSLKVELVVDSPPLSHNEEPATCSGKLNPYAIQPHVRLNLHKGANCYIVSMDLQN